jgi:DNA-directed RNA polymerase subunit RPC12/RpoP
MRPVLPEPATPASKATYRCPRCGSSAGLHYVHGHAQCGSCGANIEDCCQGAACGLSAADSETTGD